MNLRPVTVGCGATKSGNLLSSKLDAELTHEGTASFAIDAVRKLTTSYGDLLQFIGLNSGEKISDVGLSRKRAMG